MKAWHQLEPLPGICALLLSLAGVASAQHWAYVAPIRPEPPKVTNPQWPRNAVDRFVLNRLEQEGLRPSPEADKNTLLRRVTLDLTGLPPTPAELQAFLSDASPNAYEKVVDRLLASPRYGERMAIEWLDLARYADTQGYQLDSQREMWPWRDWVINAFNRNMPFDQFTVEQIAGDLLPRATQNQKIATGFNRNHMINSEGGSIPEEFQVEYVVDRVETVSTVWLGATLGCARCHDHKYDPFKQRDFYRFFAYFNNITEAGVDGATSNAWPFMPIASAGQQRELDRLNSGIAEREPKIAPETVSPLIAEWEQTAAAALPPSPRRGLIADYDLNGNFNDLSGAYHHGRVLSGEVRYGPGSVDRAATLNGVTRVDTGVQLPSAFSIALWEQTDGRKQVTLLQNTEDAVSRRGFEMLVGEPRPLPGTNRGSHLIFRIVNRWPADLIEIQTREPITQNKWHHLVFAYDGSLKASGTRVFLDGRPIACDVIHDSLSGPAVSSRSLEIGNPDLGVPYNGRLDDLRIYSSQLSEAEVGVLALHEPARAILFKPEASRSKEEKDSLRRYFLTYHAPKDLRTTYSELVTLTAERDTLNRAIPTVMIMEERDKPRDTFVLARGDYRTPREKVTPGTPTVLPPPPSDAPANRLGLARWIVDPSNPLTARVTVNRYWQLYFGKGLVKTSEDFGSRGDAPTHPKLLDWLATEFIRTGWDVKAMQRLIVTSATYRQSSRVSADLLEKDPGNRLLSRGPRFRLPAETIRDSALFEAGLLDDRIGGRSVFPYQPDGLWEELSVGDLYSAQVYVQDHGIDLYRRSLYTFWKRTAPPPSLTAFDAPDREKCTASRILTNTPMQALVLMNDPTYVEAARVLASKALKTPDPADFLFRAVLTREPSAAEKSMLNALAERNVVKFRQNPQAASKLVRVGESPADPNLDLAALAGWTTTASVVLNLDEAITKQ